MAQGDSQYSRRPVWVSEGGWNEREEREGTLDEYLFDVLWPDLAGAILEHLVMLALGGDDGLAGGLALGRVEGIWRIVHWVGEKNCGREGEREMERAFYMI